VNSATLAASLTAETALATAVAMTPHSPSATLAALGPVLSVGVLLLVVFFVGAVIAFVKCFNKVEQGTAIVRTGLGGAIVSFAGIIVVPVLHRKEVMDISVKRIEIYRHGSEGLICRDNVRADIKVAYFVRVNNNTKDVLQVAQSIGCRRASDRDALVELFDAKFSEALKTVGKNFDFTELYTERERFKDEILAHIGSDLNGYVLEDAAIDYLEQTDVNSLDPNNILDAEGIKKIHDRTATQAILSNDILREKEKTIKKQDVEAREAILELERQQAEAEQKQLREIATITAREQAEAKKVAEEERYKSEKARIGTEEELGIAEENKNRQVLVAQRNKERTDAVERERVTRDGQLEATERERLVELARIERDKALEVERKAIQEVIRERVIVERAVVEEQERIKDTQEFATVNRHKKVVVTKAEAAAEEELVKRVKSAEAEKNAAKFHADQVTIDAEARRGAAEKDALAKKMLADALAAEYAAEGLAEAEVMNAKAGAVQKYGGAEAEVIERKATAEAAGITAKADAMKLLDEVGKDHEEFKLRLDKDRAVELAAIEVRQGIAVEQAKVLGEALKTAKIDIVGGETQFFDSILNAITNGKRVERVFDNSPSLSGIRDTFFAGDPAGFRDRLHGFVDRLGISSEDVKNLSIAALLGRMIGLTGDDTVRDELQGLLRAVRSSGLGDRRIDEIDPRTMGSGGGGSKSN